MSSSENSSEDEKKKPSKEPKPNLAALANIQRRSNRGGILPGLQAPLLNNKEEEKASTDSKPDMSELLANLPGI